MDLGPLAFGDCGFESLRRHRSLSLSREFCVLSSRRLCVGLVTPTECGVSECDLEISTVRKPWPTGLSSHEERKGLEIYIGQLL